MREPRFQGRIFFFQMDFIGPISSLGDRMQGVLQPTQINGIMQIRESAAGQFPQVPGMGRPCRDGEQIPLSEALPR